MKGTHRVRVGGSGPQDTEGLTDRVCSMFEGPSTMPQCLIGMENSRVANNEKKSENVFKVTV